MVAKSVRILVLMSVSVLLCACQPVPPFTEATQTDSAPLVSSQTIALAEAEQSLHEYYTALQGKNYEQAASLLYVDAGLNRKEILTLWQEMDKRGWQILSYKIRNGRMFDERRAVFEVAITQKNADTEQLQGYNVMQRKGDKWYFSSGTLDFLTLLTEPRTINDVTVLPGLMIRGVTHIEVVTRIDNGSDLPIRWGHEGATCGTLLFETGGPVESPCKRSVVLKPHGQTTVSLVFPVDAFSQPGRSLPKYIQILQMQPDISGGPGSPPVPWEYRITLRYEQP